MSHDYDTLAAMLQEADPESRRLATQQLARVRGARVDELLVRALADDDWRVRKEAASVAPSLEPRDDVIATLSDALDEKENIGLRNAAVEAPGVVDQEIERHAAIVRLATLRRSVAACTSFESFAPFTRPTPRTTRTTPKPPPDGRHPHVRLYPSCPH